MQAPRWVWLMVLLLATSVALAQQAKSDKERLQGTWSLVSGEAAGTKFPEELVNHFKLTFEKDKATLTINDKDSEFTIKLDPKSTPHVLDATRSEDTKVLKGIYDFDGESLRICIVGPDLERPTEFASKPENKAIFLVLKKKRTD